MDGDEFLPHGPLSDQEMVAIRRILRDEERARWFWNSMRIWVGWAGATMAAMWATWEAIGKYLVGPKP